MLANLTRTKMVGAAAAIALSTCTVLATAGSASARPWHGWHHGGWGWGGGVAAGVIGGAFAAATAPYWAPGYYDYDYAPAYGYGPYAYAPGPAVVAGGGGDVAYCEAHFRSYNPATGTYLGYDGQYHPCP